MTSDEEKGTLLKFKRRLDYVDVDEISPNPSNPREPISKHEIADIKESIRTMGGVLVPIVVYRDGDRYVLLDGERRWRACKELSGEDSDRFKKIPANIIEKPPTPVQNLETMFNIHQKRKEWSTAAIAEAIGELIKLKGSLSVAELKKLTGLNDVSVTDALILLRFPGDIQKRCLNGELDEFYPILLGRNLRSLEKTFPHLFEKYPWDYIANSFMKKVDARFIRRTRDFNKIGQMANICLTYQSEPLFDSTFEKMLQDGRFTPRDAEDEIEKHLGYTLETSFRSNCNDFLDSLKAYLEAKKTIDDVPPKTLEILTKIHESLSLVVARKKSA